MLILQYQVGGILLRFLASLRRSCRCCRATCDLCTRAWAVSSLTAAASQSCWEVWRISSAMRDKNELRWCSCAVCIGETSSRPETLPPQLVSGVHWGTGLSQRGIGDDGMRFYWSDAVS